MRAAAAAVAILTLAACPPPRPGDAGEGEGEGEAAAVVCRVVINGDSDERCRLAAAEGALCVDDDECGPFERCFPSVVDESGRCAVAATDDDDGDGDRECPDGLQPTALRRPPDANALASFACLPFENTSDAVSCEATGPCDDGVNACGVCVGGSFD